jgi:hypothetical protein
MQSNFKSQKYLLLLFCLVSQISLKGQSSFVITGSVRSISGEWLSNANVILGKVDADSTIISLTQTDKNGQFNLTYPASVTGDLYLKVSIIGYMDYCKVLTSGRSHSNLIFTLETKVIILHEVVIADKSPIKIKNDTTTYNLNQFSDGTERKVEDLLRKLPGIKVSENGTIIFKGKAIDKIMLEGDNFFEKNYKLLSKNVSASLIEKIQAIENYNDENLLKGIQPSGKVVLNLKFKKNRVRSAFGNNEVSFGHPQLYNLNTTAFAFLNRLKAGFLGNTNNTGFDALDDAKYNLAGNDEETGKINREASPFQSPVGNELPTPLSISRSRYVINRARLGAMQLNFPLSSKLKLNLYGYWQRDSRLIRNVNSVNYLLPDSIFSIKESGQNTYSPSSLFGRWKLIYAIDSISSWSYTGSINKNDLNYQYQYSVLQEAISEQTTGTVNQSTPSNFQKTSYIRRLSPSSAFVAEVEYRSIFNNLQNAIVPNRYTKLFGIGDASYSAVQLATINEKRLTANGKWIGVLKKHNYEAGIQYARYTGDLYSNLYLQKETQQLEINNPIYINQLAYRKNSWAVEVKDEFTTGRVKYTGLLVVRFIKLTTKQAGGADRNTFLNYMEPKLAISYRPNGRSKFSLQALRFYNISGISDLYKNYILTDYRNFIRGNDNINRNALLSVDLNWSYANSEKYFFMYLSGNYQQQNKPFLSFLTNDSAFNFTTRIPFSIINYSVGLNTEISKFLPSLSSRFGVTGNYLQSRLSNSLNSQLRNNTVTNLGTGFYLITAFDKWYNLDFEGSFNWNKLGSDNELRSDKQLLKNSFFKQKLSLRIQPTKLITIKVTGERFHWQTFTGNTVTQFLDALIKLTLKNSRYSFEFKGLNLLNNRSIIYNNINNIVVIQNNYQLAPRYLLGTFFFDF